jgi:hypothetical protein
MTAIRASSLPASVRAKLPKGSHSLKVRQDREKEAQNRRRFLILCEIRGLPTPETEYKFAAPDRKFAFDFAWPDSRVALESVGGIWQRGGHSGGAYQLRDMEKFNLGVVRQWRILQVPPSQLCTDETIAMVKLAMQPIPAR